jgi:hypothetical protein
MLRPRNVFVTHEGPHRHFYPFEFETDLWPKNPVAGFMPDWISSLHQSGLPRAASCAAFSVTHGS